MDFKSESMDFKPESMDFKPESMDSEVSGCAIYGVGTGAKQGKTDKVTLYIRGGVGLLGENFLTAKSNRTEGSQSKKED
jgi:hypothetical protein